MASSISPTISTDFPFFLDTWIQSDRIDKNYSQFRFVTVEILLK